MEFREYGKRHKSLNIYAYKQVNVFTDKKIILKMIKFFY